jgi:hypothetical protein
LQIIFLFSLIDKAFRLIKSFLVRDIDDQNRSCKYYRSKDFEHGTTIGIDILYIRFGLDGEKYLSKIKIDKQGHHLNWAKKFS